MGIMTAKRFVKKEYPYDWWFVFDTKQEFTSEHGIPYMDMDGLIPMSEDQVIELLNKNIDDNHTLQELYDFRCIYNALLFNEWNNHEDIIVYKSRRHHDGSIPFNDPNWFIVMAILPNGKQVSNHYPIKSWDYFQIPTYDKVEHEFDGHTSKDVLDRLTEMIIDE